MLKIIFISMAKIIGYFLILFAWVGFVAPALISYPDTTLVAVGFIGSIVVVLIWLYFFIRTVQKIINKLNQFSN